MSHRRTSDAGFTLVELLVVIGVLAVIAPVVTGALILGFRSVGTTQNTVTGNAALAAFTSRFTADVHSATTVDRSAAPAACTGVSVTTVVHLGWRDTDVYYTLGTAARTLTRYTCGPAGPASAATMGSFGAGVFGTGDAEPSAQPVQLVCGTSAAPCQSPTAVTVTVQVEAGSAPIAVTAARLVSR